MKKALIVFLIGMLLCACHEEEAMEETVIFTLSREEQAMYKGKIKEVLNSFYWYYDDETVIYYSGKVPDRNAIDMLNASSESGVDMSRHSAKEAVIFSAMLTHFNAEDAGVAYFYFVRGELAGLYYIPRDNDEIAVSLDTRNVFVKGVDLGERESELMDIAVEKANSFVIPNGFISKGYDSQGNNLYINIENNNIYLYRFSQNRFSLVRSLSYFGNDLEPISSAFINNEEIAVIVGTPVIASSENEENRMVSEKVLFFDTNLNPTGEEYLFTRSGYVCVGEMDGKMALLNGRSLEILSKNSVSSKWQLEGIHSLRVSATAFKEDDIDGDGIKEYIMTDGNDFYIYQKVDDGMLCIFRTNISIGSFYNSIYTGDFNYDGVKEIYMCDSTGTTIRYTVAEHGMVVQNEDIEYGVSLHVDDFNNDGYYDYIKIEGDENLTFTLYMGHN